MNTEYKGIKISEDTKFENMDFVQYDFSMSDLSEVVFENVNFSNCTFNKTVCKKTRFWGCFFEDCIFSRVDLSDTYIGACRLSGVSGASRVLRGLRGKFFFRKEDETTGFLSKESREIDVYEVGVTSEWNR